MSVEVNQMPGDYGDFDDPLRHLQKLGAAFQEKDQFLDRIQRYQSAGWPFGRKTDAFLLWTKFRQEMTVN